MNVGLFGGTFNPVHLGHLRTIREVTEAFNLSKTLFIPAALPPHKPVRNVAAAADRMEMIRLAIGHVRDFETSDIELNRSGLSYTIDTVKHYLTATQTSNHFFLILGMDAFLEIDTWKSFRDLLRLIPMIVMTRPGSRGAENKFGWKAAEDFIREIISDQYAKTASGKRFEHGEYQPIHLADVSPLDISGTRIRQMVHAGRSIQFLVPEKVERYILQRRLYK
jgi:nicotinate-nucleotide adenylyltransferase